MELVHHIIFSIFYRLLTLACIGYLVFEAVVILIGIVGLAGTNLNSVIC